RHHDQVRSKGVGIVNTRVPLARGVQKYRNARILQRIEYSVNRLPVAVQRVQQYRLSRRKTIPGRTIVQTSRPDGILERWRRVYLGDGYTLANGCLDANREHAAAGGQ